MVQIRRLPPPVEHYHNLVNMAKDIPSPPDLRPIIQPTLKVAIGITEGRFLDTVTVQKVKENIYTMRLTLDWLEARVE